MQPNAQVHSRAVQDFKAAAAPILHAAQVQRAAETPAAAMPAGAKAFPFAGVLTDVVAGQLLDAAKRIVFAEVVAEVNPPLKAALGDILKRHPELAGTLAVFNQFFAAVGDQPLPAPAA